MAFAFLYFLSVIPTLLYGFLVMFAGLLMNDFRTLCRSFSLITGSSYKMKELDTKLCARDLSACEKFAHKILSDPSCLSSNDLSKCRSHTRPLSTFHSKNVCGNSTLFYVPRIVTSQEKIMTYFLRNLWGISNVYFSLGFLLQLSILMRRHTHPF